MENEPKMSLKRFLVLAGVAISTAAILHVIVERTHWYWLESTIFLGLPIIYAAIMLWTVYTRKDDMSDNDIIGYRLVPVRKTPAGGLATAALLQDFITNETLDSSGGGGMVVGPRTYLILREDEEIRNMIRKRIDTPKVTK